MGRIHPYGEPRVEDSPVSEFFWWVFIVGLGFPMSYGWIFVSLGWISSMTLLELSGTLGVVVGLRMAHDMARHKKKKSEDAVTAPHLTSEDGKVVPLNPPDKIAHPQERFAHPDIPKRRGYEG